MARAAVIDLIQAAMVERLKNGLGKLVKDVATYGGEFDDELADVVRSPRYATAMGLLLEGRSQRMRGRKVAVQSGQANQVWTRMRDWFFSNF